MSRVFLLFICCFLSSSFVSADLRSSVKQYKNTTVSKELIERIKRYDHLVKYFSSFAFFERHHKVSPEFIHALILAESSGNPKAVSVDNALGLGQILLTTAKPAGKALVKTGYNFKYVSTKTLNNLQPRDLFDPATNILLTCYLISKYNYKFDGRLELVISAWNAGENVKQLKDMRHAPYSETENLIGKINGYYIYLLKNR